MSAKDDLNVLVKSIDAQRNGCRERVKQEVEPLVSCVLKELLALDPKILGVRWTQRTIRFEGSSWFEREDFEYSVSGLDDDSWETLDRINKKWCPTKQRWVEENNISRESVEKVADIEYILRSIDSDDYYTMFGDDCMVSFMREDGVLTVDDYECI